MSNSTASNFNVGATTIAINYDGSLGLGTSNMVLTGSGNMTVGNSVSFATSNLGSNGPSTTIYGPASGAYKLILPSTSNSSNVLPYVQNTLTIAQNGQATFNPAEFTMVLASLSNAAPPSLLTSTQLVTFKTVTQSNGQIVVYPTSTGTSSGTALFTNAILSVSGLVWNNTSLLSGVTIIAGSVISTDLKTITCTATQSTSIILGGSALSPAPAGLGVTLTVIGY